MSFSIEEYKERNFPSFNRPEVAGYFSLSGQEREYSQDLKQLKYCRKRNENEKKVSFNLNQGIERVIKKPANLNEKLDHLLRWIVANHANIRARPEHKRWLRPEFVCYRGLLTKICCTPFENRDTWIISAAKFHGTIYLCAFDTKEMKERFESFTNRDFQHMSWGFKFEQFMLTDSPESLPNVQEPVNEAEEFCCLFFTKLGQNYLFYGAEMDGIESKDIIKEPVDLNKLKFVELKTKQMIRTSWQEENFRRKLLKWWCQSFLVGIDKVICGNRTSYGKVIELEEIKVSDMPKVSQEYWNASTCMNFCNEFLNYVKMVVNRDYRECVYKFEYSLGKKIDMQILSSTSEYSFLPDWYIEQANRIISKY